MAAQPRRISLCGGRLTESVRRGESYWLGCEHAKPHVLAMFGKGEDEWGLENFTMIVFK